MIKKTSILLLILMLFLAFSNNVSANNVTEVLYKDIQNGILIYVKSNGSNISEICGISPNEYTSEYNVDIESEYKNKDFFEKVITKCNRTEYFYNEEKTGKYDYNLETIYIKSYLGAGRTLNMEIIKISNTCEEYLEIPKKTKKIDEDLIKFAVETINNSEKKVINFSEDFKDEITRINPYYKKCDEKVFEKETLNNYFNKYKNYIDRIIDSKKCSSTDLNRIENIYNSYSSQINDLKNSKNLEFDAWYKETETEILSLSTKFKDYAEARSKYNEEVSKDITYTDTDVCANTEAINKEINNVIENNDGSTESLEISEDTIKKFEEDIAVLSDIEYENWDGCDSLPEETTKLIKYVLWGISIIGIILTIVLTVTEIVGLLMSGVEENQKKVMQRLQKRLIALGLLILAPIIANLIFDLLLNEVLNLGIEKCEIIK